MTDLATRNLEDLTARCFLNTAAPAAARLIDNDLAWINQPPPRPPRPEPDISRLYGYPRWEHIGRPDTSVHAAFEALLKYYSVLEIGCIAGLLPDPLPEDVTRRAKTHLAHHWMKTRYEESSRLLLPVLFRRRLEKQSNIFEPHREGTAPLVMQFLEVNALIETNASQTLLGCLSSTGSGSSGRSSVFRALGTPWNFWARMIKPTRWWTPVDRAIHGFGPLVEFYREFVKLLEAAAEYPLLQSALWHYHAYWLTNLRGQFGRELRRAIEAVTSWPTIPQTGPRAIERVRAVVGETMEAISRLATTEFEQRLAQAAGPVFPERGSRSSHEK